jgi:hypothetical protein
MLAKLNARGFFRGAAPGSGEYQQRYWKAATGFMESKQNAIWAKGGE